MTFSGLAIVLIVIVVIALAIRIGTTALRATVLRRGGLNPLVAREQLEARFNQTLRAGPSAAALGKSKEDRLSEVMDLHARGIISDDELAAARTAIIND